MPNQNAEISLRILQFKMLIKTLFKKKTIQKEKMFIFLVTHLYLMIIKSASN